MISRVELTGSEPCRGPSLLEGSSGSLPGGGGRAGEETDHPGGRGGGRGGRALREGGPGSRHRQGRRH